MQIALDAGVVLVAIVALWKGADLLVESAARIAHRLGMSQLIIGLTVVAFCTSAPELMVSLVASIRGQADISIGNVVGSNIFNLGFILGGVALLRTVRTSASLVYRDGLVLIVVSGLLFFFLRDQELSRGEGITMLALLAGYLMYLILGRHAETAEELPAGDFARSDIFRLVGGAAAVVLGGHFFVEHASNLARHLGMSEWAIGVTIVAAGTSAPELATSLMAAVRGRHGLSAGNLIGSDIFNILGVLGIAGTVSPMMIRSEATGSLIMLCGLVLVVVIMMRSGWRLSRTEGAFLIIANLIRWWLDVT